MTNEQQELDQPRAVAPAWHTSALILLIVVVAISGLLLGRGSAPTGPAPARGIGDYIAMAFVPWMLTLYVARLGRARNELPTLLGRLDRWPLDLAIGVLLALAIRVAERLLAPAIDPSHAAAVRAVLPGSLREKLAWLVVAVSVGFGEEVVYRGYLQSQLRAFTGSVSLGVALQAALFGVAHLNQGVAAALRIALYGVALGLVALQRSSLLPAVFAHVIVDASSAFS